MSRFLSALIHGLITLILAPFGDRRLKILARVKAILDPVGTIVVRGQTLTLSVPDATAYYWISSGGQSEPGTLDWVDGIALGDVLYDIGANVGLYSLYAAAKGIDVVAFEPNPFTFPVLARNLDLNRVLDRVLPLPVALDRTSRRTAISLSGITAGSVGNGLERNDGITVGVLSWSLDDLIAKFDLPHPTHIKLDVDGIEAAILEGSAATLADPRMCSVLVEDAPDHPDIQARVEACLTRAGLTLAGSRDGNRVFRRAL